MREKSNKESQVRKQKRKWVKVRTRTKRKQKEQKMSLKVGVFYVRCTIKAPLQQSRNCLSLNKECNTTWQQWQSNYWSKTMYSVQNDDCGYNSSTFLECFLIFLFFLFLLHLWIMSMFLCLFILFWGIFHAIV